tara:strand:- start:405 stop:605 length:201 start_codon:yes stop_codon:yes gene_type:complete
MPTEPKSSWVKDIFFNNNVLTVNTVNGESYNYQGVDGATYNEMVQAKSKGKFHNSKIRGKYDCIKG